MAGKSATDFDKRMGERITRFRLAAGLSQRTVAEALGVTVSQLGKYERGINCLKANAIPVFVVLFGRELRDFFDPDMSAPIPATGASPESLPETAITLAEAMDRIEQAVTMLKGVLAGAAQHHDQRS